MATRSRGIPAPPPSQFTPILHREGQDARLLLHVNVRPRRTARFQHQVPSKQDFRANFWAILGVKRRGPKVLIEPP